MKDRTMHCILYPASLGLLLAGAPLAAQAPVRVNTPGTAFSIEGRSQAVIEDVAGGRRFRGKAGAKLMLRAVLQIPPATSADPKVQRLVIHFRTSKSGPSLRSVQLLNGTKLEFRIDTNLEGDYTARETTSPDVVANAWAIAPRNVSSQTVVRLEVQFPTGFDSAIDPGEFVLTAVRADFSGKLASTLPGDAVITSRARDRTGETGDRTTPSPALPSAAAAGAIYVLAANHDLVWYSHAGRNDGTFRWAADAGKKVGSGWTFKQVFSGGDGVIYAITENGDLLWYRHDGRGDGSFRWAATEGKKIGSGWNFKHVFSGGEGVIYAITENGDLLWYRHDGRADGTARWAAPTGRKVGQGWAPKQIFSGGGGVIYIVTDNNDLVWYRHDGRTDGTFRWAAAEGKKVGAGWAFDHVFAAPDGVIYAVTPTGDLLWYRHDGRADGSFRWTAPQGKKVGNGWVVKDIFAGPNPGS